MRRQICLVAIASAVSMTACEEGAPVADEPTSIVVEEVQLRPCPDPDPMQSCRLDHAKAGEYLSDALKGDYQAQRNISAMHSGGAPWLIERPIQACGWRMVIMVSRPAVSSYDDEGMYGIQCRSLSETDFADARTLAGEIYGRIHGADLPPLPPVPGRE